MSLDHLDAAFVQRLSIGRPRGARVSTAPSRPAQRSNGSMSTSAAPGMPVSVPPVEASPAVAPSTEADPQAADPIVARLLDRAPGQWRALAADVESARQRGRRVIGVAGSRVGEGRTTLVRCLAATLRDRGRDVACVSPSELAAVASGSDGRGPTHDKRIILVDAGIWFPPGPIRRAVLQVASLGCEAAILVRRAGAPCSLARQAALEAIGVEVLGEVLTFVSPLSAHDTLGGDLAA